MMEFTLYFISALFLPISVGKLYQRINNDSINNIINKRTFISLIIICPLIQTIAKIYQLDIIIPIFTLIYFIAFFKIVYKSAWNKSIIYALLIWILSILIDMLMMLIMGFVDISKLSNTIIYVLKTLSSIGMCIIIIGMSHINWVILFFKKIYEKINHQRLNLLIAMEIIGFFFSIELLSYKNIENQLVVLSTVFIGIFIGTLIVQMVYLTYQKVILTKANENLCKDNAAIQKLILENRIFKHNLESQLIGIKSASNQQVNNLIDDLIRQYNNSFDMRYEIDEMPTGLHGIVMDLLLRYQRDEINMIVNNEIHENVIERIGARNYNLFCETIGITLKNAIEACIESTEKLIYIKFKETNDSIKLKIINTFNGSVDLIEIGNINYSSKKTGHGLGLFSLIRRKNLKITTNIKNNLFIVDVEIKNKKMNK